MSPATPAERVEHSRNAERNRARAKKILNEMFDHHSVLSEYRPAIATKELLLVLQIYRSAIGKPPTAAELEFESTDNVEADQLLAVRRIAPNLKAHELRRVIDSVRAVGNHPNDQMGFTALSHVFAELLLGDVVRRAVRAGLELAADPSSGQKTLDVNRLVRKSVDELLIPALRKK